MQIHAAAGAGCGLLCLGLCLATSTDSIDSIASIDSIVSASVKKGRRIHSDMHLATALLNLDAVQTEPPREQRVRLRNHMSKIRGQHFRAQVGGALRRQRLRE